MSEKTEVEIPTVAVESENKEEEKVVVEKEAPVFKLPIKPVSKEAPVKPPQEKPPKPAPVDPSNYYEPPSWARTCPSTEYYLEVIRNGTELPDDAVHLGNHDHVIFGRQPASRLNPELTGGRTATLLHPSVSRSHAVLVYGAPPPHSSRSPQERPPGWHIYDLGSTHGTFVNKHRLPVGRFLRLHVGYVLRFGSSTRLLILHGPESDVQPQTPETWSELVAKRKARLEMGTKKPDGGDGDGGDCNWGMDDGAEMVGEEEALLQRLQESAAACLNHEAAYMEDPKKALRAYFDREGIDPPPEYEFVEGKFGQQMCRIELPLEAGTIYAEVPYSGRKKEAVAACALEACRMLDRLGEFDANREGAEAARRAREKAYWESNDYYSSDEDTFLDRTGDVEARRRKRMRRFGVEPEEVPQADAETKEELQDSFAVLARLEALGKEIIAVENQLNAAEKALEAAGENASELDELEAYMQAIKNGAPKRAERQALKRRLVTLRQEETRLLRRVGIRDTRGMGAASFSSSAASTAAAAIRTTAANAKADLEATGGGKTEGTTPAPATHVESKLNALKRQLKTNVPSATKRPKISTDNEDNGVFVPEEEEDDDDNDNGADKKQKAEEGGKPPENADEEAEKPPACPKRPPKSPRVDETTSEAEKPQTSLTRLVESPEARVPQVVEAPVAEPSPRKKASPPVEVEVTPIHKEPIGPVFVPEIAAAVAASVSETEGPEVSTAEAEGAEEEAIVGTYDEVADDPNFALWLPPQDQTGDGMTELNKKYGY